jgi:CRP/FNR family cyclic AMP-dependent transcriptional regulator
MEDLDFSGKPGAPNKPSAPATARPAERVSLYDPKLALEFFRLTGTPEQFPAGHQIFVENEKTGGFFSRGARIYLLLEGDVTLTLKGKPLEMVLPGEIFGELAVIAELPRSATATARKNCRALSLDEKQFVASLQQMPQFALMLLSVMSQRLRRGMAKLAETRKDSVEAPMQKNALDKKTLTELQHALGNPAPARALAGQNVMTQGAVGACMFVVTEGRITISIDGSVIEHVEAGGTFGELAMVDGAARAATATAETDCAWLLIARSDFLAMIRSKPAFGLALLRSMSERVQHVGQLLRAQPT